MRYFCYLMIFTGLMWMFNPMLLGLGWLVACTGVCINDVFA